VRTAVVIGLLAIAAIGVGAFWLLRRENAPRLITVLKDSGPPTPIPTSLPATPSPSPSPSPSLSPSPIELSTPAETPEAATPSSESSFAGKLNLIIPVAGVRANQLVDTFTDARSEGRTHDAIDIPAAAGTPVLAAADGQIIKLFQSERGGTTIYQSSTDKKLVFYYAHLQAYAAGLLEGQYVRQGETIAYVGDSGNAGAGNFHLHFSITIVADPKRYWEGTNINPYPLLHR
jgi:peptidoglycan LD-endopeptidase LytH